MLRESKKNFLIDFVFLLTVVAIAFVAFRFLSVYLFPVVIGIVLTALVQKPANFVSKTTKINKGICALVFVLLSYTVVIFIIALLFYFIYTQGLRIAQALPSFLQELLVAIETIGNSIKEIFGLMPIGFQESVNEILGNLVTKVGTTATSWISGFATSAAINMPEFIVAAIVTVVASCYIAKDYDKFKSIFKGFLKTKHINLISDIRDIVYKNVFKLLKSYIIIMAITFVELSIGMLLFGIENGIFVAFLISIVDILPVLGSGTVLIPWSIISLVQGNFVLGIELIVLYFVILIIRNIIEPKIIGNQVGLHPLVTLIAIFVGLRLFGVIGMFILPIIAIVVFQLYRNGKLEFLSARSK